MMQLPYLVRGTPEWDNREYMRYLMGCKVMSFGPLTPELMEPSYVYVSLRIEEHLSRRGVDDAEIQRFIKEHRPKCTLGDGHGDS